MSEARSPAAEDADSRPEAGALVLEARALDRRFVEGAGTIEVLRSIDLRVAPGERIAVVGASGSGKSTLMHLLGGLDRPDGGSVFWGGVDVFALAEPERARARNHQLGFVYQFHHLLAEFDALENVAMPLLIRGERPREAAARARALLGRVGLEHRLAHRPAQLSGGERQRVALARALVGAPKVVLADEPTGNLDRDTADLVQAEMLDLNAQMGTALIVVTHDPELAARMDRVLRLEHGALVAADLPPRAPA
ncbi:MAG TPA: ATP-binding cassette domain-containing protein [Pseudomonadales bacterium]|nr:ATP-binding cassette domain-containing protein [Pseudomonadales bacterium]